MDFLPMPHSVRKGEGLFPLRYDTRIVLENTEPSSTPRCCRRTFIALPD